MTQSAHPSEGEPRFLIFASAFFFLWYLSLYLAFWSTGFGEREEQQTYILFFLSVPVCALIAILWKPLHPGADDGWRFGELSTAILSVALPALIIVWGLKGIGITLYHTEYETPSFSVTRFAIGSFITLAVLITTIFLHKKAIFPKVFDTPRKHAWINISGYFLGFALLLSLFDINITLDTLSYDPYVGPAAAVLQGAIPLVDVFSQYGLNFLLFSAALKVLPWSLFSTTLVVALLNTIYYITVCLIVIRITRNRLLCFLLSIFIVMFLQTASLYNITYTPSVLAMRFLPPLLLVFALTYLPQNRWMNHWTAGAMVLCALWSMEALAFGAMAYAAYIFILGVARRKTGIREPASAFALLAGCIALPHILLSVGYQFFFGQLPRYDIYWELLASNSTTQAKNFNWLLPVNPEIRTWVLFGFGYALGLAYSLFRAWRTTDSSHETARLAIIGALCTLGIVQFFYYMGRSATPVLVLLAFPLAILFIVVVDKTWSDLREGCTGPKVYLFSGVLGILLLAGMGGVFADRFFRPMTVTGSNSTILRSCLSNQDIRICRPDRIFKSLRRKIQEPVGFPANEPGAGGWSPQENEQAYFLVQKYLKDDPRIFLFVADSASVLFFTKKTNRLGLTHTMVDGRSSKLTKRAMQAANDISEGTVVIVGDTSSSQTDEEMLSEMRKHWTFCRLESRNLVTAYKLQNKAAGQCPSPDSL